MRSFRIFGVLALVIGAAGCQNTLPERSLVFFTGTSLGLEVSANPSSPEGPVKLVIGYKRVEGVLNPVYNSNGVETILNGNDTYGQATKETPVAPSGTTKVSRYLPQAYSVIAKINGEADASAASNVSGKIAVGQWFATGKAAETLALQPGIAGAVSGSAEIATAAAATVQKTYGVKLTGISAVDSQNALRFAYKTLSDLTADASAQKVVTDLDTMSASLIPASYPMYETPPPAAGAAPILTVTTQTRPATVKFDDLLTYMGRLKSSADAVNNALKGPAFTLHSKDANPPADVTNIVKTDATGTKLASDASQQTKSLALINTDLQNDPAVISLFEYFVKIVTQ